MRFWDSSAVVPLLVRERASAAVNAFADADPEMLVWWATPVECTSALARLERERSLPRDAARAARSVLKSLAAEWHEVLPADAVRSTAERLLRVHPLRAGDALQLAAAVIASEHEPGSLPFVCLDERLADAAAREGFEIVEG